MKSKKHGQNSQYYLAIAFLWVCHLYYGYRYILQYSSESTSPTYANTPLLFQAAKYILAAIFIALVLFSFLGRGRLPRVSQEAILIAIVTLVGSAFMLTGDIVGFLQSGRLADSLAVKALLGVSTGLLIAWATIEDWEVAFKSMAVLALLYHGVYEIIQIVALFLWDRTPALGYLGVISRFGGGWDDPNGFGMFLILPFSYFALRASLDKKKRWRSLLAVLFVVGMIVATFSYSAAVNVILAVAFISIFLSARIVALCTLLIIFWVSTSSALMEEVITFSERKASSTFARVDQFSDIFQRLVERPSVLIFGSGEESLLIENYYVSVLYNYGIVPLVLLLVGLSFGIKKSIWRLWRHKGDLGHLGNSLPYYSALVYVLCFVVASNFVPFFANFPVNVFFWGCLFVLVG